MKNDPLSFLDEEETSRNNPASDKNIDPLSFLDEEDFSSNAPREKATRRPPSDGEFPTSDNAQGWLSATGTAIARGAVGIPQMTLGALAGADRLFDRYIKAEPENDPDNWDLKQWAHSLNEDIEKGKNKMFRPATSGAKGTWSSGVESFVTSAGVTIPAFVVGTMSAPAGAITGLLGLSYGVLSMMATAPAFGLQQYDEAVDRYVKEFQAKGASPEKARDMAEVPALIEFASDVTGEWLSDIIGGKLMTEGLSIAGKKLAKSTLGEMLKVGLGKDALKRIGGITLAEGSTEMLNALVQGTTQDVYGKNKKIGDVVRDPKFWDRMEDQFGAIMVSSVLFGVFGAGTHVFNNKRIANALENPVAPKEKRLKAAEFVAREISEESKPLANVWWNAAKKTIDQREPISFDTPIDALGVENPRSTVGQIARVLAGGKPLAPPPEQEVDLENYPQNEDEIDKFFPGDVLDATESGSQSLKETEATLKEKGIDTEFIKGKVAELGSIDAVSGFYTDDSVGDFARAYAELLFGEGGEVEEPAPGDRRTSSEDVAEERRTGKERRDLSKVRTDEMTEEEMRKALTTNELTLIPNRRGYEEAEKKKVRVSIDADSLKWINDNMGHAAGDDMLKKIAKIIHEETGDAFHISGDEFIAQGESSEDLEAAIEKAKERLAQEKITARNPNGKVVTKDGIDITYGLGTSDELADQKLAEEKVRREKEGKRAARGETPAGIIIAEGEEGHDQKIKDILSGKETETPKSLKEKTTKDGDKVWDKVGALQQELKDVRGAIDLLPATGDRSEQQTSEAEALERKYEVVKARHDYLLENGEPARHAEEVTVADGDKQLPTATEEGKQEAEKVDVDSLRDEDRDAEIVAGIGDFIRGNKATGRPPMSEDDFDFEAKYIKSQIKNGALSEQNFSRLVTSGGLFAQIRTPSVQYLKALSDKGAFTPELFDELIDRAKKTYATEAENLKPGGEQNGTEESDKTDETAQEDGTKERNGTEAEQQGLSGEEKEITPTKEDENVEKTPEEKPAEGQKEEVGTEGEKSDKVAEEPSMTDINKMSDDELSSMFDKAAEEVAAEDSGATESPTTTQAGGQATQPGGKTSGGSQPGRSGVTMEQQPSPTEALDDFVKHASAGAKHAFDAMSEIFKGLAGDGSTLKSGIGFDDATYQKVKPHLKALVEEWTAAGRSIGDFFKAVIRKFGLNVKPYLMQFLKDSKAGTLDEDTTKPNDVDLTEGKGKKKGDKKKGGKRVSRIEAVGEKITGMRKDAADAMVSRKDIDEMSKPLAAIYKRTSGILRGIAYKEEATHGVRRLGEFVDSMVVPFSTFAGNYFGGSRGKYGKSYKEAIESAFFNDQDNLIEKVNEYISALTDIHNILVESLTLDDSFRGFFELFIKPPTGDNITQHNAHLASKEKFKDYVQTSGYSRFISVRDMTNVGDLFKSSLTGNTADYPIYDLLAESITKAETEYDETKNREMKRKKRKIFDIETDGRERKNEDITAQFLLETFGLRGIDFGNWTEGKHQQKSINLTFDSFYDLLNVLGVPKSAKKGFGIFDNENTERGQLGITYGAHARGGKNPAAFYPSDKAMGFTKTSGDGALAHEWMHAFDTLAADPKVIIAINDLKQQLRHFYDLTDAESIIEGMVRNSASKIAGEEGATMESIRKSLRDQFDAIFHKETDFYSDAKKIEGTNSGICGQKLEHDESYWANDEELLARAFEAWVSDKLNSENRSNEYLVGREFVKEGGVGGLFNRDAEAYPKGDTRVSIAQMFEYLFDNLEWSGNGPISLKEGYEHLGEKNKREAMEALEKLLDKGEELFNSIYAANPSEDDLFWYSYKSTARGSGMQPQGFFAYDDSYSLPEDNADKGDGEGAVAYPERLSIEQARRFGLISVIHDNNDNKIYLNEEERTGGENGADTDRPRDISSLEEGTTQDGQVPPGEGASGEGGGVGGGGVGTGFGSDDGRNTGGQQRDGTEGGEGDSVSQDVQISDGEGTADTAEGNVPISAATPLDYELTGEDASIDNRRSLARRLSDNVNAVKLLRKIESENRLATAEEQKELVKYSGWGGLGEAFSPHPADGWKVQASLVKEALTEDEFRSANEEIVNAYYTPKELIDGIYSVLQHMGFKGGRILEPAIGTGNFFGAMPTAIRGNSILTGVERSALSSKIAKHLYQSSVVHNKKFQHAPLIPGAFDLVISNVPFDMDMVPTDSEFNQGGFPLQRYFIKKSIDLVRPGGVVAVIASTGALDRTTGSDDFFNQFNMDAELLGAFRLPAGVFKGAGTNVVSDVIFIRKKGENLTDTNEAAMLKQGTKEIPYEENPSTKSTTVVSQYFIDHPDHVLGTEMLRKGRWTHELTVVGNPVEAINKMIDKSRESMRGGEYSDQANSEAINPLDNIPLPEDVKAGGFYVSQGGIYRDGEKIKLKKGEAEKIKKLLSIRDIARKIIRNAYGDEQFGDGDSLRKEINSLYDEFVKKHGHINAKENVKLIAVDPDAPLLLALEKWDAVNNKFLGKRDIFTTQLNMNVKTPESADTIDEALGYSLSYKGKIDFDYISLLTGKGKQETIEYLGNRIYDDPLKGWVSADEYLSGHVSRKLRIAEKAVKGSDRYKRNVDALKKVLPPPIPYKDIYAGLGAPWISPQHINDFIASLGSGFSDYEISYVPEIGKWTAEWNRWASKDDIRRIRNSTSSLTTYGAARRVRNPSTGQTRIVGKTVFDLMGYALNGGTPVVNSDMLTAEENEQLTDNAIQQLQNLQERFKQWIFSDAGRATELQERYNGLFTGYVRRRYDGSHLPFNGKVPDSITALRAHQKNAVWRFITEGTVYFGHQVGTGKTYTMAAAIMESKRLGLMNKPLLVTTNETQQQIADGFLELYPGANLLVINFAGKKPQERQALFHQIATGNWDAILVTHDQLKNIPISIQAQERFINAELLRYRNALNAAGSRITQRKIQALIDKKEEQLQDILAKADPSLPTMESVGIDGIVVDEAHEFKNLTFPTTFTNVKGLAGKGSNRADDLFIKTRTILAKHGRNVIFASGTPVSNSVAEVYLIQRYLQQDLLDERMIHSFDMWIKTFGQITSESEPAPEGGGFNIVEKISSFHNLPELLSTVNAVLDTVRTSDTTIQLPRIKGGEFTQIAVEPNKYAEAYKEILINRAMRIKELGRDATYGGKQDIMLSLVTAGRLIAMDPRLINPSLPDSENTKTNTAIKKIMEVYNSTPEKEVDGVVSAEDKPVQFVFADLGVPHKDGRFNIYDDIKQKLIALGVKEDEIYYAQDYKKSRKKILSAMARSGEARIIIGSTKTLGVGINAQTKLAAVHNLDVAWNYANYEQRLGRMIRQGNFIKEVSVFDYGMKSTADMFMWSKVYDKKAVMDKILSSIEFEGRVFDEESAETMTAGEMLTALADDPEHEESIKVKRKVRQLGNLLATWQYNKAKASSDIESLPGELDRKERDAKNFTRTLALIEKANGVMLDDGTIFDFKKDGSRIAELANDAAGEAIDGKKSKDIFKVISFSEIETEEPATDKDGKELKNKDGSTKTKKVKTKIADEELGKVMISESQRDIVSGVNYTLDVYLKNHQRLLNDIPTTTKVTNEGGQTVRRIITVKESMPTVARILAAGKKHFSSLQEKNPAIIADLKMKLKEAKALAAEKEFPQMEELNAANARNEELTAILVERLRQQEEIRRNTPRDRTAEAYFPEPMPEAAETTTDGGFSVSDESDNGPLFSRRWRNIPAGAVTAGMAKAAAAASVSQLKLENAPEIISVQNEIDLPVSLFAEIVSEEAEGKVPAVYDRETGKVYVIANNLADVSDVHKAILHEVTGHFGLRGILGDKLLPVLAQVAEFYGVDGLQDIADRYKLDLSSRKDQLRAAEEMLASEQETGEPKDLPFLRKIYAKIRQLLRSAGFVNSMTNDDIKQLLVDARKFAERGKTPATGAVEWLLAQRSKEPGGAAGGRGKSLFPSVQERMDKAKGASKSTFASHLKGFLEKIHHSTRHFPLLDPKKWGELTNYLRVYEEVPSFSKYVAKEEINKFIKDLSPEDYDVFRMNIILSDLMKDVQNGLYTEAEEAGETLPFGYNSRKELQADLNNIEKQTSESEKVSQAIDKRSKFMKNLKERLVEKKLLPKDVLNDEAYFHHQVVEYLNAKQGTGTSSKDVRLHKKGFQKSRSGYTGDYNTQYVESEFEVIAHAISQLETASVMERIDGDLNIIKSLRADAKIENTRRVYDKFNYNPSNPLNEPTDDPFFPFRVRIAVGLDTLGKQISEGDIRVPRELEDTAGRLAYQHELKLDPDRMDLPDSYIPINEELDEPSVFQLLSYLINKGGEGAKASAMVFKAIRDRKAFVTSTLGNKEVTWKSLINKETHRVWKPKPFTAWYMTNSITDKLIARVINGEKYLENEDARKVLARGADVEWVIPTEVADTLDNFRDFKDEGVLSTLSQRILNAWKQWVLINPLRFFKYNVNNMSGDLDIVFAYAPEIIREYFVPAMKDLVRKHRGKQISPDTDAEMTEAMRQGILNAGMTVREIPDITKVMELEHYVKAILPSDDLRGLKKLGSKTKGAWFSLKDWTNLRENILRLAAYRYFKDQLAAGKNTPGISEMTKASQIKDRNEKAAMLARELLGDYGNLSQTSEWLRRQLIPFWSWQAINAPRYYRLFKNLRHDEIQTGKKRAIRGAGAVGWQVGKTSLKMALLFSMVNAWNAMWFPEEEEALGESGRRQLHLILGKRADGSILSLRLQGALSDALGWFAMEDLPSDVRDLISGRESAGKKVVEALQAPAARIYQGSRPLLKTAMEAGIGLSTYPKFLSPRPVRDKVEHILRTFSMDKLWNHLVGKPMEKGSHIAQLAKDLTSIFAYETDVDVSNYYDIRKKVFDFREKETDTSPQTVIPSKKSTALFYYKQALRIGDVPAAERYLKKYFDLGGTPQGIRISIKMIHPLGGLPKRYRAKFIASLDSKERKDYRRAVKWYTETYLRHYAGSRGVVGRAWVASRKKK